MTKRTDDIGAAAAAAATKAPEVIKGVAVHGPRIAKKTATRLPSIAQQAIENGMEAARQFGDAAPGAARSVPGLVRSTPDLVRAAPDLVKAAPAIAKMVAERIIAWTLEVLSAGLAAVSEASATPAGPGTSLRSDDRDAGATKASAGAKTGTKTTQRIAVGGSRPSAQHPARRATKPVTKKKVAKKKVVTKTDAEDAAPKETVVKGPATDQPSASRSEPPSSGEPSPLVS